VAQQRLDQPFRVVGFTRSDRRRLVNSSVMATWWTLGCDATDPQRLARFWADALGYVAEPGYDDPDGASIIDPDGAGPAIGFLRVPEGKTAKNRMHIDVRVARARIRDKAAELVAAGATQVREEFYGDQLGHVVLLDPEGNEFCVATNE
jgi:predicted enzyme related to lactoylglutathione lyase